MDIINIDVVVIGAGIGGLSAARTLISKGLKVVVLEARDRNGGRILTHRRDGKTLDLGATWFWPNEPRINSLIEELNINTFPQYLSGDAVYQTPGGVERLEGNPLDVPSGRFSNGAMELVDSIAAEIGDKNILYNNPVSKIVLREESIEAYTEGELFSAENLVLAVPPALAVNNIKFNPALPEELYNLAKATPVWMGSITKVAVLYEEPFWRRDGLSGSGISYVGPMREVHDMSGPGGDPAAIFGFAPNLVAGKPTIAKEDVIKQLTALFDAKAANPVELLIQDWRAEEFTSPKWVERINSFEYFGHPSYRVPWLNGTLHWASTETSSEFPGHIEGALAAAERAAKAIISK